MVSPSSSYYYLINNLTSPAFLILLAPTRRPDKQLKYNKFSRTHQWMQYPFFEQTTILVLKEKLNFCQTSTFALGHLLTSSITHPNLCSWYQLHFGNDSNIASRGDHSILSPQHPHNVHPSHQQCPTTFCIPLKGHSKQVITVIQTITFFEDFTIPKIHQAEMLHKKKIISPHITIPI